MIEFVKNLSPSRRNEEGASAVEYGLLVALIAAVIVLAVFALGGLVRDTFKDTCTEVSSNSGITPTQQAC